ITPPVSPPRARACARRMAPSTSGRRWAARAAVPPSRSFAPPDFERTYANRARILALQRARQHALYLWRDRRRGIDRDHPNIVGAKRGEEPLGPRLLIVEEVVHRPRR